MTLLDRRLLLRQEILEKVKEYFNISMEQNKPFVPGQTYIPYAARVYDDEEITNLVDSALEFWLTAGRYTDKFEKDLAAYLGVRYCSLVNSGSSANLLAFMALTSDKLKARKIQRGDEVITVAAGFPTTIAPVIQYGAVPVFVDIDLGTYNININELEKALSKKTKAVVLAHTLGNSFNLRAVKDFCEINKLWLIEDNCDALGARYENKLTGTFGDIGTSSFYPSHHITLGEGGAVYTDNHELHQIIRSMRDWGRDCCCPSGSDNVCGKRFNRQMGELPYGYDHKYIYSHLGYNLKATDMQAAIGCAQLLKLPGFINARKNNWNVLMSGLCDLSDLFILPEATENSEPSWFGFALTIKENSRNLTRDYIVSHLESKKIQTRMLFSGNIIKHPCFDTLRSAGSGYRVIGDLSNTDRVMNDTFWIGVYPGLTEKQLDYMICTIRDITKQYM